MTRWNSRHSFYTSDEWSNCKKQVFEERKRDDGTILCKDCGKVLKAFNPQGNENKNAIVFHHEIEITDKNMNDYDISLNPERITVLCWRCHNERHNRFIGNRARSVYIVVGAPLSGKTTYVRENMRAGDLIYDFDSLYEALSGCERYVKPKCLFPIVDAVARELKAQIKMMRQGTAWVIIGKEGATQKQRQDLARELNGEVILMDCTKEECLRRLENDARGRDKHDWARFIEEWYSRFTA